MPMISTSQSHDINTFGHSGELERPRKTSLAMKLIIDGIVTVVISMQYDTD